MADAEPQQQQSINSVPEWQSARAVIQSTDWLKSLCQSSEQLGDTM